MIYNINFATNFIVRGLSFFGVGLTLFFPTPTIAQSSIETITQINSSQELSFHNHFQNLQVEGSILIYDLNQNQFFQHNPQRNLTEFPTASTFKILNSLIALETGVIKDEIAVLTWDGISRDFPSWNRDLNLKEAFNLSGVWFYQVLARRVGYETMQQWLNRVDYGNKYIGDQENLDQFWLNGNLKITPYQQINFLRRLYENELPFSERSQSMVKEIMINEKTPNYKIRGKTGWYGFGNNLIPNIGWYIGYVETKDNVYFFATNIDMDSQTNPAIRLELTRLCLNELGIFRLI
jgi:beta-lactamase class D